MDSSILDDPVWEYVLVSKLQPYMNAVKHFWEHYSDISVSETGVIDYCPPDIEAPAGLMLRITSTPVRSPIKNVQVFPFVPTAYLNISGVAGGVNRMVERVCNKGLDIDGMQLIEKHNLPSTYHSGQFIAFVPKTVLEGRQELGKYVYLTCTELYALAKGELLPSIQAKCHQYTNK